MRHLNPLPHTPEDHRMLSDQSLPTIDARLVQLPAQRLRDHLRHLQRGPAWGVLLETIMGLNDLDVVLLPEGGSYLSEDLEYDVDPDAHIGRDNAWNSRAEFLDPSQICSAEACGPNYDRHLRLGGDGQMGHSGLRGGEVDYHLSFTHHRTRWRDSPLAATC